MITNHIVFVLGIHGKNRSFNVSQYLQNRPVNPHRCSRNVSLMDILPPEVMCVGKWTHLVYCGSFFFTVYKFICQQIPFQK